ncbi:hypothetical protein FH972_026100 [Carpinus fangiana]|uniref:EF-hand domain-containing protein n=1 Tax=Carpinus fangiana TaxID=176857 RepID=A0A5N6L3Y9_9ROSI|nr:hypothetical protein FH972_026100 [Carpinus fangiana]
MAFPKPALQAGCSRFRGDLSGFHLYPWYANFHYTMERHREALLWSYLMKRSDVDGDGFLSWSERQKILEDLKEGSSNAEDPSFRTRTFYHVPDILESAGLEPPIVNTDILWTSLDGPVMIKNADCFDYDVNECMAPGFSIPSEEDAQNPFFSSSTILDRVSRQQPECGDCLIKLLLHREKKGLSPMLPLPDTQEADYEIAVKALIRYQYTIVDTDAMFMMITDAEQVESTLIKRFKKKRRMVGQMCLNDDVTTEDEGALEDVKLAITDFYESLFPKASPFER